VETLTERRAMHPLRKARADASLSVAELARISGVSSKSIYSLEEGHRKGSIDAWRRLAGALGVPMDEIVGHAVVPLEEPA
jgi:transcriptional regulator with XRE-family HTH domain